MATRKAAESTALPQPRRRRATSDTKPAPTRAASSRRAPRGSEPADLLMPVVSTPSASTQRWRDAARIVVVMLGVALTLMVANHTAVGLDVLGVLDWAAYAVPLVLVTVGLDLLRRAGGERPLLRFEEVNGILSLFAAILIVCGSQHHGGPLGNALADELGLYFGISGVPLATVFLTALGLVLALHITVAHVWLGTRLATRGALRGGRFSSHRLLRAARRAVRLRARLHLRRTQPALATSSPSAALPIAALPGPVAGSGASRPRGRKAAVSVPGDMDQLVLPVAVQEDVLPSANATSPAADVIVGSQEWAQPPIEILEAVPMAAETTPADNALRMRVIEDTLAAFNVRARVIDSHSGPTVTQFDVQPERGVRVQRITALQNDLALALAARSIRIQAPVPGHSVIGIEIPNAKTSVVTLRDVLESDACAKMKSPLKIALGKDVSGGPVIADLARMPHLLIAGATGSGKSVCLNSLISCLLFHNSPERLRLLVVDPKMVELTVFNDVPHLLAPVVTDVTKVTGILKWALKEMHRRYKLFAEAGARNLARYNELKDDPKDRLPFIVLIIDELADLMMVSPEDVEDGICRLAQLARATGMHLVLATQRPSVDVITGLIKANFPARIAFAVSSQVDSRTILDQAGAEKLMGRGDMLYQPSDESKPIRVQGTYLSDQEIEELVRFWKQNSPRQVDRIPEAELESSPKEDDADSDDKLLNEAIRVLREYKRASVSLLQRRLSIGYTRAARLLDVLEERGVVGPSEDGRSRIVLETNDVDLDDGFGSEDDEAPPL